MSIRRVYETTIIINAALEDTDIDAVVGKITAYIENHGGEIEEIEKWGRRRLAYPINKKFNGYYVHIIFQSLPSNVPVLERFLVLEDTVLRHLTLVLPDKLRAHRAERALRQSNDEENSENNDNQDSKPVEKKVRTEAVVSEN
jgi:small subunit ribosomal protein S6